MLRLVSLVMALVFCGCWAASAAMGPQKVKNTVHNLSTSGEWMYISDNEDEICIFCHTPHGGSLNGPLWNRALPGASEFTHYTTATLDNVTDGASRALSDESLLCMSCHDGAMAINHVLNPSNRTGAQPIMFPGVNELTIMDMPGMIAGVIGKSLDNEFSRRDLTDDHPISFSYDAVRAAYQGAGRGNQLHAPLDAVAAGVRFYSPGNRVECGSCHDPHVNYDSTIPSGGDPTANENYRPFLITPNIGSALCLACHNK